MWPLIIVLLSPQVASQGGDLHQLLDSHWQQSLKEQVFFRMDSDAWRPDGRLAEWTPAARARRRAFNQSILEQLAKIDVSTLSAEDQINYRIFKYERETEAESNRFFDHMFPINSLFGYHTYFAEAPANMSLRTVTDLEKLLISYADFPRFNREHIAAMREGIAAGMTQYGPSMRGVAATIQAHIVDQAEQSLFYQPFAQMPSSIDENKRVNLQQRARDLIQVQVIPAYRELLSFINDEYLPKGREKAGISSVAGGNDYYQYLIRYYTTTDLTPESIHQTGLGEVKRIRGEMEQIIQVVHFKGDFKAFLHHLRTRPESFAADAEDLLEKAALITRRMDAALPTLFSYLPRSPYAIKPSSGRGAYYVASTGDGTTPGTYFISTDVRSQPLYNLEALSFHEAVPGHHLQSAIALEQDMPAFRKPLYHAAFGEGWGLYSERLGKEAGFYKDAYSDFGRLTYEMWRACRLVVDTGIHANGWTRQQAIDFIMENTALTEAEVTSEVDRYITWPAQALAYKIGELRIRALRTEAEQALGDRFDLRTFHDQVIGHGSLPIAVLEDLIREWIKIRRKL